jgi:hypothetical protein
MNTANAVPVDRSPLSLTLSPKGRGNKNGTSRKYFIPSPPGERARERGKPV